MTETIQSIPLDELHDFPSHPFGVRDDDAMRQTVESIREYGVFVPAIARPREDGGYEIIAGHRRKHACQLAGLKTMPVIVRDVDRNAATIIMVDSNLQRENILPSEKAKAYKMKIACCNFPSLGQLACCGNSATETSFEAKLECQRWRIPGT